VQGVYCIDNLLIDLIRQAASWWQAIMKIPKDFKKNLTSLGFAVVDNIYSSEEINQIAHAISSVDSSCETFRKSEDLFAIRQFLKEIPEVTELVFNDNLVALLNTVFTDDYFITKSIYFDKPEKSNWFVSYHQDLTISVDKRIDLKGWGPWTVKQNQFAVQPPLNFLENNFTIRIHLDTTTKDNGALKVMPGSHLKGIYRPETIDWTREEEMICEVPAGGIMFMSPLLLHSSGRTVNNSKRRVIHIEFSKEQLPHGVEWAEYLTIKACH
jgi:ectoine hydroxylase-related dioxygenase (phytanoyl-CoA dioxygenase family)